MYRRTAVAVSLAVPLAFAACAKSDPSQLISPSTPVAAVQGSFAQNPIPFNGRGTCPATFPNSWIVRPTLKETGGVNVSLKSWSALLKDGSGAIVESLDMTPFMQNLFGGTRLSAGGSLSAAFLDCEASTYKGGALEYEFFGVDDGGFPIRLTLSATLVP
jgi:hypothetical protein